MSKKIPHRKRIDALSFEIDESHVNPESGIVELNLHFNLNQHELRASLSHNNQQLESNKQIRGYFGENKVRTLWEIPKDKDDHSLDFLKKLKRYDNILAMDTNSIIIKEERYSIGIAGHVIREITETFEKWDFKAIKKLFVLIGEGEKIEIGRT